METKRQEKKKIQKQLQNIKTLTKATNEIHQTLHKENPVRHARNQGLN